jgi:signal peptidase
MSGAASFSCTPVGRSPAAGAGVVVRAVLTGMGTALLGLAVLALLVPAAGLASGRLRVVPVLSGSMRPTFDAGAAVVAVRVPARSVRRGEVLVFQAPTRDRQLVVHRVVDVGTDGPQPVIRTKGDANATADPWRARLLTDGAWRVRADAPGLGRALVALHQPRVRVVILLLVVTLPLGLALWLLWHDPDGTQGACRGQWAW